MRIGWNGLRFLVPIMILACSTDPLGPPSSPSSLGPGVARRLGAAAVTNGPIAFWSTRDGNNEIYVMNPDGTGQTNLTNNAAADEYPAWSPDGTEIAFQSDRDGNFEIYVMNADGTGPTRLTNDAADDLSPAWSPDGTQIAFEAYRDGNGEIYVMNATGTGPTNLSNNGATDAHPAWSPDGTQIAFASDRDGNFEVYVMNADGTGQTRLTNDAGRDFLPAWSPDGSKIAFTTNRDGDDQTYVMNPDGTGQTNLTNNPLERDDDPAWSPDGTKIASSGIHAGGPDFEIWVMNADGTGLTNLTNDPAGHDYAPSWGPDQAGDGDGDGVPHAADNCPNDANPDQSDLDQDGTGDACEASNGAAQGNGRMQTEKVAGVRTRAGITARFIFDFTTASPPSGPFTFDASDGASFVASAVDYLEVTADGDIYASGEGARNGRTGWGFCLSAEDNGGQGGKPDRLDVRLWQVGRTGQGCPTPKSRYAGPVTQGDVAAAP